jgi:hypothetical protein
VKHTLANWIVCGGVLAVCAILFIALPQSPANAAWYGSSSFFPVVTGGLAAIAAISHLVTGPQGSGEAQDDEIDAATSRPWVAAGAIALLGVYALATLLVGLAPATVVFAVACAALSGLPLRRAVIVAVVLAALLYCIFVLAFKVWFPTPLLLEWVRGA